MRITTRLATAGEAGFLSMPAMRYPAEHYAREDGHLDEAAVRHELGDHPGIVMSSDDNAATLAFTVELLDRMKRSMGRLVETSSTVNTAPTSGPKTSAQRRFDKGRVTFVRVDIKALGAGGFRVKLSAANPKEVVGRSEQFAELYAQAFADNLVAISDSLAEQQTPVELIEGEGCSGAFDKARERNDRVIAFARHQDCPNRHNGYCSPSTPGCELYHNGRCLFEE